MSNVTAIVRRHWKPLLALNCALFAATVSIALYWPRTWTATARVILPNVTGGLDASLGTLGNLRDGGNGFSQEVNPPTIQATILKSDDVIQRVWMEDPEKDLYKRLEQYASLFKVSPKDQSTVIEIEVKGSSAELAQTRAQTLLATYQARLNELRQDDAAVREKFSREELTESQRNLAQAQLALSKFKQATGLVNVSEQTRALATSISTLAAAQAQALGEGKAAEIRSKVLASRIGMTPEQAFSSLRLGENKEYQAIRQKLSEVEIALTDARGIYTDKNERVQSLVLRREELLKALKQELTKAFPQGAAQGMDTTLGGNSNRDARIDLIVQLIEAESTGNGAKQQAAQIQQQLDKFNTNLRSFGKNEAQLLELERKYNITEGVYKGLVAQIEQAKISAFNSYPNVQILDRPYTDPKPTSPKVLLIALGGALGSIFGSLALALGLENRNPLFGPKDLQRVELPVLGRISRLAKPAPQEGIFLAKEDLTFQRLASSISIMPLENRRLLVTSSTFGEGKTSVTLGLALALNNLGFRVLLVDADFHKADLSERFAVGKGSTEQLTALGQTIPIRAGLDLLPTVAKQEKIRQFVVRGGLEMLLNTLQAEKHYDYILVDSSPMGLTSEASLMATFLNNVLFVVRPGVSDRFAVAESLEQLTRQNAHTIGLCINGIETRTEMYRYGRSEAQVSS
jgi:polysaccharide biosynthesis transport protein